LRFSVLKMWRRPRQNLNVGEEGIGWRPARLLYLLFKRERKRKYLRCLYRSLNLSHHYCKVRSTESNKNVFQDVDGYGLAIIWWDQQRCSSSAPSPRLWGFAACLGQREKSDEGGYFLALVGTQTGGSLLVHSPSPKSSASANFFNIRVPLSSRGEMIWMTRLYFGGWLKGHAPTSPKREQKHQIYDWPGYRPTVHNESREIYQSFPLTSHSTTIETTVKADNTQVCCQGT